jgi:predicted flap endonuclease-1-like 5' DNA nuclease
MGNTVVLAFFQSEAEADDAAEQMKEWDKLEADVKLNAMGVLALDDKGKIKTHKLGRRSVGKGAGIGLLLAIIAPPTLLAGVVGGGILGALHRKNLGVKGEDQERIAAHLAGGRAALGILVKEDQAPAVEQRLTELGGTTESHPVEEADEAEAAAVAPEVEAAEAEVGDDLTIIDGVGPAYDTALKAAGIKTFAQLSEQTPEGIASTLASGNAPLFAGQTADTWPRQAKLAAAGDWSGLRRYIDSKK